MLKQNVQLVKDTAQSLPIEGLITQPNTRVLKKIVDDLCQKEN